MGEWVAAQLRRGPANGSSEVAWMLKIKLAAAVIAAECAVLGWMVSADLWVWCWAAPRFR